MMNARRGFVRSIAMLLAAVPIATVLAGCAGAGTKTGEYVDDSTITTKIKTSMATDKDISALAVHVSTDHGAVVLSGTVKSQAEKERAGQIARSVAGVKSVENDLMVAAD